MVQLLRCGAALLLWCNFLMTPWYNSLTMVRLPRCDTGARDLELYYSNAMGTLPVMPLGLVGWGRARFGWPGPIVSRSIAPRQEHPLNDIVVYHVL